MEIIRTDDFEKSLRLLPIGAQKLYQRQVERFLNNWHDPRLHVKKVQGLSPAFSFRVTRVYRAFFYFQNPDRAIFFNLDHRKDAYRRLVR